MKRTKLLKILLFVAVGIITVRLFFIQIVEHQKYVALAEEQQTMQYTILAERGEIYMMDGIVGDRTAAVVMNEPVWTVLIDPMLADEGRTREVVDRYAKDQKVAEWNEVFKNKNLRYFVVARNVTRDAAEKIKAENLPGVWFQEGVRRVYTEGQMASGVLGFVNADGEGQYGIEGALDEELSGKNGLMKTVKDVNNIPLTIGDDNVRVPAEDGKDIVLTIDRNIQRRVEKALQSGMDRSQTTHASAVVMDPNTGKIWAMANLPTYDATNYAKVEDAAIFQNDPAQDAFEPASVCKTFAFSAAIDSGVMTPDSTYDNTGSTVVDGWTIQNAYQGMYGTINMQTALNFSLNTGSTQALRWLGGNGSEITQAGKDKLYYYYHDLFNFGEYTGIEVPESDGIVIPATNVDGTNARYANMTFGQGLNITMVQVAAAFSSVINGGEYYTPTLIEGEMVNGELVKAPLKEPVRQTISTDTSATMRKMLWGTRSYKRTGGVDRSGYYVGGKTGTSQAIRDGKYVLDQTLATYVGFGSAGDENGADMPEYVIMVKIWEDGKRIEGEKDAAPIFDELSNYLQDYLKIKPKG